MEPDAFVDYFSSRDGRAVVYGWDTEWTTGHRPFGNTEIARIVAAAPERFVGLGAVDPLKGAAAVAQVHEAARFGLTGVALHPQAQGFDPSDRITNPVWDAADEHDLICAFHTGTTFFGSAAPGGAGLRLERGRPIQVDSIAARWPNLRVVLVHGGTLWLDEAIAVARHKRNVYVCLGGQRPDALGVGVLDAIDGLLSARVMFGSGFPFAEPLEWIEGFAKLGLSDEASERVLYANAAALFDLA